MDAVTVPLLWGQGVRDRLKRDILLGYYVERIARDFRLGM